MSADNDECRRMMLHVREQILFFFFSSRRRHTRFDCDWSSDVCSSDLVLMLHNRYLVPGGEDQSTSAEAALLSDYGHSIELLEHDNREIEHIGKTRKIGRASCRERV